MLPKIINLIDQEPFGVIGLSTYDGNENFNYYIGAVTNKNKKENMSEYRVPKGMWTIFKGKGKMPMAI